MDLIVEIGQQHQIGSQYPACDHRVASRQCIAGRGDQTLGDRATQLQVAGCGEPDQPVYPEGLSR